MNGAAFPKGCAGAVWSNGDPAWSYCLNRGYGTTYSWYAYCCKWESNKCMTKFDNTDLQKSLNYLEALIRPSTSNKIV